MFMVFMGIELRWKNRSQALFDCSGYGEKKGGSIHQNTDRIPSGQSQIYNLNVLKEDFPCIIYTRPSRSRF